MQFPLILVWYPQFLLIKSKKTTSIRSGPDNNTSSRRRLIYCIYTQYIRNSARVIFCAFAKKFSSTTAQQVATNNKLKTFYVCIASALRFIPGLRELFHCILVYLESNLLRYMLRVCHESLEKNKDKLDFIFNWQLGYSVKRSNPKGEDSALV